MTTEVETAKIIALLREYYPRDVEASSVKAKVRAWFMIIGQYDYATAQAAVVSFAALDTKGFMPSPGQIVEAISKITRQQEMTEMEAWGYVTKAVSNSLYNADKEWVKLPPSVQNALGSASVLREWAMCDTESFQTVVQSNFMRSFKARSQADREYAKLPESVRTIAGALADKLSLPERTEG